MGSKNKGKAQGPKAPKPSSEAAKPKEPTSPEVEKPKDQDQGPLAGPQSIAQDNPESDIENKAPSLPMGSVSLKKFDKFKN